MPTMIVSWKKLDSNRKKAAKDQCATELNSVVLMIEHFGDEIGQSDAEERSCREGKGTANKLSARVEYRSAEPEKEGTRRTGQGKSTIDDCQTSGGPPAGTHD